MSLFSMDYQSLLVQLLEIKQSIDESPRHEVQATCLILLAMFLYPLYLISTTFNLSLNQKFCNFVASLDFGDENEDDIASSKISTPGEFLEEPEDRSLILQQSLQEEKEKFKRVEDCLRIHHITAAREAKQASDQIEALQEQLKIRPDPSPCYQQELERTKQELEASQKAGAEYRARQAELSDEVKSLETGLEQSRKKVSKSEKARREQSARIRGLELELRCQKDDGGDRVQIALAKEKDLIVKTATTHARSLAQKDFESLKLEYENQVQKDREIYEREVAELQSQKEELLSQLQTANQKASEPAPSEQVNVLKTTVEEQQHTIEQLSAHLSALHEQSIQKDAVIIEIDAVKAQNEAAQQREAKIREDNVNVTQDRDRIQKQMAHMQGQMQSVINEMRTVNVDQQSQLRALKLERESNADDLKRAQQQSEALQNQLSRNTEADPHSRERFEHELNRLNMQNQQVSAELTQLKTMNTTPSANLQTTITKLNQEIKQERLERARAQGRFDETLTKLATAKQKLAELERAKTDAAQAQRFRDSQSGLLPPNLLQTKLHEQATILHTQHEQALSAKDHALQTLHDQNSTLQWTVTDVQNQNKTHLRTIADLEIQLSQSAKQVEAISSSFQTTRQLLQAQIQTLQNNHINHNQPMPPLSTNSKRTLSTHYRNEAYENGPGGLVELDQVTHNPVNDNENGPSGLVELDQITHNPVDDNENENENEVIQSESQSHPQSQPDSTTTTRSKKPRTEADDTSTLDWDLFDGPLPPLFEGDDVEQFAAHY